MDFPRTPEQIEAEIAEARERLTNNVQSLVNQVHPKAVVQRGGQQAKDLVDEKIVPLKKEIVTEEGDWRTDRLAMIAASVAGVIILIAILRKIFKH
ncbi:MAG: DUF3618 domain-containing protein [Propionibacteriaceae bacterium]|nr:DUF3618 domain-containing protein [Propionibacteriaceae bacterium]